MALRVALAALALLSGLVGDAGVVACAAERPPRRRGFPAGRRAGASALIAADSPALSRRASALGAPRPQRGHRGGAVAGDRMQQELPRLHIAPSTHRTGTKRSPRLRITFQVEGSPERVTVMLPKGYSIRSEASCAFLDISQDLPAELTKFCNGVGAFEVPPEHIACEAHAPASGRAEIRVALPWRRRLGGSVANGTEVGAPTWWTLQVEVQYPAETPARDVNTFELRWRSGDVVGFRGDMAVRAWPLLGNWGCLYSDWEGWGICSARCGGGVTKLRRRILLEPPEGGDGEPCSADPAVVEREVPCNLFPCEWKCSISSENGGWLATEEHPAQCTARCGGGSIVQRRRWVGERCPNASDMSATVLAPCNAQPCGPTCVHERTWVAISECDAVCGEGRFLAIQPVADKSASNEACQPREKYFKCIREVCSEFIVTRPDRDILPFAERQFTAGILFSGRRADAHGVTSIELSAPEGYAFGEVQGGCNVSEHDLMPFYRSCTVGRYRNKAVLRFDPPIFQETEEAVSHEDPQALRAEHMRRFSIDVEHPSCPHGSWRLDPVSLVLVCGAEEEDVLNHWRIDFVDEGGVQRASYAASGYALFADIDAGIGDLSLRTEGACTGPVVLGGNSMWCIVAGAPATAGSPLLAVEVRQCQGPQEERDFILPVAGRGQIRLAARKDLCLQGNFSEGLGAIALSTCAGEDRLEQTWALPLTKTGAIRWGADPKLCIGIPISVSELLTNGGSATTLAECPDDDAMSTVEWALPCEGLANSESGEGDRGTEALVRRRRPQYCTIRNPCRNGCRCGDDGVCEDCEAAGGVESAPMATSAHQDTASTGFEAALPWPSGLLGIR